MPINSKSKNKFQNNKTKNYNYKSIRPPTNYKISFKILNHDLLYYFM